MDEMGNDMISMFDKDIEHKNKVQENYQKPFFDKYKVILILFVYLLGLAYLSSNFLNNFFMLNLMGFFFIIFSFFKIIHLAKFNMSFKEYDLFAKIIPGFGFVYPFIELVLGVLFLMNNFVLIASFVTVVILFSTTIGVILKLCDGEIIECACLGQVFGITLSNVTVFENVVMILMACFQIYLFYF